MFAPRAFKLFTYTGAILIEFFSMKWMLVVVGVAVIGASAYLFMSRSDSAVTNQEPQTEEVQTVESTSSTGKFNGSVNELLARGGSWKCTVAFTAEGMESTGTTYVSNGMMRADFSSTMPQVGNVETHLIVRDNTAYTWTSMMNQGFKFPIQNGEVVAPSGGAQAASSFNQDYDFNCEAWSADSSKFALPGNITF